MIDKLTDILDNEKAEDLVPFLQSLTKKDKKNLTPLIKSQIKELMKEYRGESKYDNQVAILSVLSFVCLDYKDFMRHELRRWGYGLIKVRKDNLDKFNIDSILEWYCPDWLDQYVNNQNNFEIPHGEPSHYEKLLEWYDKGYITTLSPELIVNNLPGYLVWWNDGQQFEPNKIYKHPITLKEHIWYLFQYQSLLADSYSYEYSKYWHLVFKMIADDKKVDRIHILKQILLTANNTEMNKPLINWFVGVFDLLEPTDTELLEVQNELLMALNSLQSKPVAKTLKYIKRICSLKDFREEDFISVLPVLVASPTKSVINGSIDISESFLETGSQYDHEVCTILCSGFLCKDESVQKKIAKVLAKYGKSDVLSEILDRYANNMLESIKPILEGIMLTGAEETDQEITSVKENIKTIIRADNKIQEIDNFEDYLFFLSQAFDNNEPYHCFMVPVYILQFDKLITADNIAQLEPICKKVKVRTIQTRDFDAIYAAFFVSYIEFLHTKYPDETQNMMDGIGSWYWGLDRWMEVYKSTMLYPNYHILGLTLDKIMNKESEIILISTPTHAPLWIDPVVLVERIAEYQFKNILPDSIDLQMAIQRTVLANIDEAFELAIKKLKDDELKSLILYLLDAKGELPTDVVHPEWWITAYLTKNPYAIPTNWKIWEQYKEKLPEYNILGNYTWSVETDSEGDSKFKIDLSNDKLENIGLTNNNLLLEYTFKHGHRCHDFIDEGDIQRHIYSNPYVHAAILAKFLFCIENFKSFSANDKKGFVNAMSALYELELPFVHIDYLLLAWAMMCSDKVVKDFSGELWIKATALQIIDNNRLGQYIQELFASGKFPIKRFTDLLDYKLTELDLEYQRELIKLITSFLIRQIEPHSSLKKLLEIYFQLLSLCKEAVNNELALQFELWQQTASLKKVIKQINDSMKK